jgi:hypothetical protein
MALPEGPHAVEIRELWFSKLTEQIVVPGDGSVTVTVASKYNKYKSGRPFDLWAQTSTHRLLLEGFGRPYRASPRADEKGGVLPWLQYAILPNGQPLTVLVGARDVVFVDGGIRPVLRMHRDEDRDAGFDKVAVLAVLGAVILVYERGAASIRRDGTVVWHQELTWNDLFDRIEDDQIVFWSEFVEVDGEEYKGYFALSLPNGKKIRLPGELR